MTPITILGPHSNTAQPGQLGGEPPAAVPAASPPGPGTGSRTRLTETVLQGMPDHLMGVDSATVYISPRGGGSLYVYQAAAGSSTWANPLTTRDGRIEPVEQAGGEAWLETGSYDLIVSYAGQSYTSSFEAVVGQDIADLLGADIGDIEGRLDIVEAMAVNVKAPPYLAVGDGTTDDSAAVQAAWDAAGILGADVFLPPGGTFIVTNVQASSHTRLIGSGRLKQKNASAVGACVVNVPGGVTDVTVDGVEIDGNKTNQTDQRAVHGVAIAGQRIRVTHCYIHDTEYNNVSLNDGASYVQIVSNYLYDAGFKDVAVAENGWGHGVNGEATSGITGLLVESNHIVRAGQHGVRGGDNNHYWSVHDNHFEDIGHDCFAAYNENNTHLSFTDNQVNGAQRAGCHLGGTDLTAADNTMQDCRGVAVLFGSTPNADPVPSGGGTITGNIIRTTLGAAIETRNFSRVVISGNEIDQSALASGAQQGILCQGTYGATVTIATDIALGDNIVWKARGNSVQFSNCTNCQVTGGSIRGGFSRGLRLSNSTDITVSGATISDNVTDGIFSDGATTAPDGIVVTGSSIRRNGGYGIRSNAGDHMTIDDNDLRNNTTGPLLLAGTNNVVGEGNKLPAAKMATNSTNASFTMTPFTSAPHTVFTAVLTNNRNGTLSTTGAQVGMKFRVTRTAASTGAFTIDFGVGLKALAVSQWAEATFDGTAWVLTAFGSL